MHKSNLKRIRDISLVDEIENDFDPEITESYDTSAYEYASKNSHSPCSDIDQDNTSIDDQPKTLEKADVT